ncbi:MAG: trypsin-like peptidase domain-containing protein [Sedimentisphaerales bacterium]|jgi:serine protease Do
MRLYKIIACVFACAVSFAVSAAGDIVVLKGGQKLIGDIVAEKPDRLYVDVGVTVLAVPKQDVLEYHKDKQNEPNELPAEESTNTEKPPAKSSAGRLYYSSDTGKIRTIEQGVADVAEAVLKVSTPAGLGSGFFINEQGYLITNYHVIEKETKIEVTVFKKAGEGFDKKVFKSVRIVALNPFVDLALLKVEDLGDYKVRFVVLGDVEKIRVGEPVFAIGNPLGLERTVTNGVISSTSRPFEGLVYLQTNADINPGNSGGPLFNLSGEVIGVTNRGYIFFGGLGFAIPVDYVRHFIDNRETFAYDKDNPNTGYRYIQPDGRHNKARPDIK